MHSNSKLGKTIGSANARTMTMMTTMATTSPTSPAYLPQFFLFIFVFLSSKINPKLSKFFGTYISFEICGGKIRICLPFSRNRYLYRTSH